MGPLCSKPDEKNDEVIKTIRESTRKFDLPVDQNDTYFQEEFEQWIQFENQEIGIEDAEAEAKQWCMNQNEKGLGVYTFIEHNVRPVRDSSKFVGEPLKFKISYRQHNHLTDVEISNRSIQPEPTVQTNPVPVLDI